MWYRSGYLVWLQWSMWGTVGLWANDICFSAVPVGQDLAMCPDSGIYGLENSVALSGVKLKRALPRVTPPPGFKGEASLFWAKDVLNHQIKQFISVSGYMLMINRQIRGGLLSNLQQTTSID